MELLQKIADEKGIDLTMTPEEDAAYTTKWSTMHQTVEAAPLTRQAKRYMKACHEWLETSGSMMSQKQEELKSAARMDLPDQHPLEDAILLKDALEVISWYHFQIVTKLMRAQSGRFEDEVEAEDVDFPKDSDGSAKVALIGIDRSIA
ncbi:MAG TPA: hypothetical protein VJ508_01030, partial [Saprospiraceae bacterium]|nr:hypothetical protein [Saprospiraceae bacterium]